jgi:hypothetical protein
MMSPMAESEAGSFAGWLPRAPALRRLVAVHLALAVVPGVTGLTPAPLPLTWTTTSVSIGQLMLLSFWAGMGTSKGTHRLFGTVCGVAYSQLWRVPGVSLGPHSHAPPMGSILSSLAAHYGVVLLLAGVFLLLRRMGTELRRASGEETAVTPARFQYSILHLLLIISVVAVVLGLVQTVRRPQHAPVTTGQFVALLALVIVVVLVNLVCAAWAALGTGPIRLRLSLVLIVAVLLGIAFPLATGIDELGWRLFVAQGLVTVLSTVIVLVSLLVVRWCGYRLIRKGTAQ